ncbi:MAG: MerR family transcriptional regulator [Kofleriaceae bacterium]|nr:MerR family transcriptional regulator [Myxococcales bacterium]MCB9563331.1 MerR family transcriptional regulator [Kofleriaceae bacterium]MCB9572256.1 MerR family transcriptional regulator [Kofleriaceae bacterium]
MSTAEDPKTPKLMRVGELAKMAGKTVRAMHLYEELGLLEPAARSDGGFRLYGEDAVDRIHWIVKLQAIGFTLSEIQGFIRDFQEASTGRDATTRARAVFAEKLRQIRDQVAQLQVIENDLLEAVAYLDSCDTCTPVYTPHACGTCDHHGHHRDQTPQLFAGLSRKPDPEPARDFDVPVGVLTSRDPGTN